MIREGDTRHQRCCETTKMLWDNKDLVRQQRCCETTKMLWDNKDAVRQQRCCETTKMLWDNKDGITKRRLRLGSKSGCLYRRKVPLHAYMRIHTTQRSREQSVHELDAHMHVYVYICSPSVQTSHYVYTYAHTRMHTCVPYGAGEIEGSPSIIPSMRRFTLAR
jgi:hypothetical protein